MSPLPPVVSRCGGGWHDITYNLKRKKEGSQKVSLQRYCVCVCVRTSVCVCVCWWGELMAAACEDTDVMKHHPCMSRQRPHNIEMQSAPTAVEGEGNDVGRGETPWSARINARLILTDSLELPMPLVTSPSVSNMFGKPELHCRRAKCTASFVFVSVATFPWTQHFW